MGRARGGGGQFFTKMSSPLPEAPLSTVTHPRLSFSGVSEPEWQWLSAAFPTAIFDRIVGPFPLLLNNELADGYRVSLALLATKNTPNNGFNDSIGAEAGQWVSFAHGHQMTRIFEQGHPEELFAVLGLIEVSLVGRTYLAGPREDAILASRLLRLVPSALVPLASARERFGRVLRWLKHLVALWPSFPRSFASALESALSLAIPSEKGKKPASDGKKAKPSKTTATTERLCEDPFELVDLRVGRILQIDRHPSADRLYVEQVDFGPEFGPARTIVSGLVQAFPDPVAALLGRLFVFIVNLKPASLCKTMSHGMLLVGKRNNPMAGKPDIEDGKEQALSSGSETKEDLYLPEISDKMAKPGDRVLLKDAFPNSLAPLPVIKSKDWDAVKPRLVVRNGCIALLNNAPTAEFTPLVLSDEGIPVPGLTDGILS